MKKRFKSYQMTDTLPSGQIIMVYGELWEDGKIDGLAVFPCKFTRDGKTVLEYETKNTTSLLFSHPYSRTKHFNMGWAICNPEDKFDENVGRELCKKRFRKSDITTQCGTFLTKDVIYAILANEIIYIKSNLGKFLKKDTPRPAVSNVEKKLNIKKMNEVLDNEEPKFTEVTDGAECPPPVKIEPGLFVMMKDEKTESGPMHAIGKVRSIDEKTDTVVFDFEYAYTDNGANRYVEYDFGGYGIKDYLSDVDHVATPKEVATALAFMKNHDNLVWDENRKRLVNVKD